jgi:hypothetical protein
MNVCGPRIDSFFASPAPDSAQLDVDAMAKATYICISIDEESVVTLVNSGQWSDARIQNWITEFHSLLETVRYGKVNHFGEEWLINKLDLFVEKTRNILGVTQSGDFTLLGWTNFKMTLVTLGSQTHFQTFLFPIEDEDYEPDHDGDNEWD